MTSRTAQGTRQEEAAALLAWLQQHNAVVLVDRDGRLSVDLNPVTRIQDAIMADAISRLVLSLKEEIKALLLLSEGRVH